MEPVKSKWKQPCRRSRGAIHILLSRLDWAPGESCELFSQPTGLAVDRPIATGAAEIPRCRRCLGRRLQRQGIVSGRVEPNRTFAPLRPVPSPGFRCHFREDRVDRALGCQFKTGDLGDTGSPFHPPRRCPSGRWCVCRKVDQHVVGNIGKKTLQAGNGRFQQLGER